MSEHALSEVVLKDSYIWTATAFAFPSALAAFLLEYHEQENDESWWTGVSSAAEMEAA